MSDSIMQDIRDKIARLEASAEAESRHNKTTQGHILDTQDKMLDFLRQIAENQGKMQHLGGAVDEHTERISAVEKTQERLKMIAAATVFVACALVTAYLNGLFQ